MSEDDVLEISIKEYVDTIGRLAAHIENIDKKLDRLIELMEKTNVK